MPPQYGAPPYDPQYAPPPAGGRFSSFLHNAVQTAAGVVAGEVAFSALSSLFGGHQGGGFFGGGSGFLGGGGGISPGSETIVNNYYGDDPDRDGQGDGGLSPDLEDRRFAGDNSGQPQDDTDSNDDNTDDTGGDDSSYDDGSGSGDV
jgi:hypothetical protein